MRVSMVKVWRVGMVMGLRRMPVSVLMPGTRGTVGWMIMVTVVVTMPMRVFLCFVMMFVLM